MNLLIALFLAINTQIEPSDFVLKKQEAIAFCKANNLNTNYCVLIDMSIHSGKKKVLSTKFQERFNRLFCFGSPWLRSIKLG